MFQLFYQEEQQVAFIRFTGAVEGAEAQQAVYAAAVRSGGKLLRVLLDYREVTRMDLTETDGALATVNTRRLRGTGVDLVKLAISYVTSPDHMSVNDILLQRIRLTAPHRVREGLGGFNSAERSLDEALEDLGLSSDSVLPY